jgi:hypothetical protein
MPMFSDVDAAPDPDRALAYLESSVESLADRMIAVARS